jgi:tol-pal system protein YbgF
MQRITHAIKSIAVIGIALSLSISAINCAKIRYTTKFEMDAVRDTIREDLTATQAKIIEEQKRLLAEQIAMFKEQKESSEMLRLMRADILVRFNEIDRKVSAIERNLSESQSRISRLDQKTSEFSRRLEQKLASEEDAVNQRKVQIDKLFEIAMSDFNAGRYDLAVSGFTDFAKQFPDAPQAPEAEYWIAEARFAKKEYEAAEKEYMQLIKKYPDGAKSCAVFYKLGLVYEQQDKKKSMEMVWNNLLQRCPDTEEAQSVKSRKQ